MDKEPNLEIARLYENAAKEMQDLIEVLGILFIPTGSYFERDPGFRWGVYESGIDFIEATHRQVASRMWHRGDTEIAPIYPSDIDYRVDLSYLPHDTAYSVRDIIVEKARDIYNRTRVYVHILVIMPEREYSP